MNKLWIILTSIVLWAPVSLAQQSCEEAAAKVGHGGVLWSEQAVIVQGTAAPNLSSGQTNVSIIKRMAQRAAQVDAYRKAAAILAGVRVTSFSDAGDSPRVTSVISALISGATLCKTKFYADGGVDVAIRLPLTGAIAAVEEEDVGRIPVTGASAHTGLIIDARHLDFVPAVIPRVLSPAGAPLFDRRFVSPEMLERGLAVHYSHTKELAAQHAGENPISVKAVALGDVSPSDLVVDAGAAGLLDEKPAFLGSGSVVVLTREPEPVDCRAMTASVNGVMVDWQERLLLARGNGQVDFAGQQDEAVQMRMMERAAEVDAERLLTSHASEKLGLGSQASDSAVAGQHTLVNAVRCGAKYFRDGKAELVLGVPVDRIRMEIEWGSPDRLSGVVGQDSHTGLIVDATQVMAFVPSLAPVLSSIEGQTLYSASNVSRSYGRVWGGAGYHTTVVDAAADVRVGSSPVMIEATGVAQGEPGKLLLSDEAAAKLASLASDTSALRRGAVVIVVAQDRIRL